MEPDIALPFVKMEGAGNDYVYVDGLRTPLAVNHAPELARLVSDRHFGVGSDGLIELSRRAPDGVLQMSMWNADGSASAMCGNGLRCLAKFAHDQGHVDGTKPFLLASGAGEHQVELLFQGAAVTGARVDMGVVSVASEPESLVVDGVKWSFLRGDAGNPHAVLFVDRDPDGIDLDAIGRAFQASDLFIDGVNVEVVRVVDGVAHQRTFERGSGETLACGSGATVVGLATLITGRATGDEVVVSLRGGDLRIMRRGSHLVMEGPARTVFTGEVTVSRRFVRD